MRIFRLIVAVVALLVGANALAQENNNNIDDNATDQGIAAQPLNTALEEFAERSGLQVIYVADVARGVKSQGADPDLSDQATLDQLLASTELEYEFLNHRTVTVQPVDQGGDSDSKNLGPTPVLMAQNTSQTLRSTETGSRSDDGATSVVTGKVTDARTGANLKGAKVTIEETGQWTSTNDLGEFRFVNVPRGSATLTVSFLGYAGQSVKVGVRDGSVAQNFALRGGSEIEEIVVFGQRSARALALNMERTADNFSTVLSADQLGQFPGTTISEALRRAPGVAFIPDPNTGDGANIIIRGLEPDLNQITLNGLRLPEGSGQGRSADLSGILTDSISSVIIHKTLLPSHDSNGVGGLVEIETKSPLDRPRRLVSLNVESAGLQNDFSDDVLAGATLSGIFGDDESLGLSLSAQYRDRKTARMSYAIEQLEFGQYLPVDEFGQWPSDPRQLFPYEPGVMEAYPSAVRSGVQSTEDTNLSITGSIQKQISNHTDLRLDWTQSDIETTSFANSTAVLNNSYRILSPVPNTDGQDRAVLVSEDIWASIGFPGIKASVDRSSSWSPNRETKTNTLSFRGTTRESAWTFDYGAGLTLAKTSTPLAASFSQIDPRNNFTESLNPEFLQEHIRSNTFNGLLISIFDPVLPGQSDRFLSPSLNQAGFDFYNDISGITPGSISVVKGARGENERSTLSFSINRDFDVPWIDYIKVGGLLEESDFDFTRRASSDSYTAAPDVSLADVGLGFTTDDLSEVGANGDFLSLTRRSLEAFFISTDALVSRGLLEEDLGPLQLDRNQTGSSERDLSAYFESKLNFGKLEIIGGVRMTQVDVDTRYFVFPRYRSATGGIDPNYPSRYGQALDVSASQTDVLPRIVMNYRLSDNSIIRGGYFNTASRPRVANMVDFAGATLDERLRFGPGRDQPLLRVSQGNPDLNPTITHNYDLSWEWYTDALGVIKISGYLKEIDDPLHAVVDVGGLEILPENLPLPDTPEYNNLPDNLYVQVSQPVNGDNTDRIWGAELAIERQFTFLPGIWSGLGFYGNFNYADSASERVFNITDEDGNPAEVTIEDVPFSGSPKYSGTAALTYNGFNIDANVVYSKQQRRLSSFERHGLHRYNEALSTLDFRIEYIREMAGTDMRFFIEGNDLLRSKDEPYIESSIGGEDGVPKYYTGGIYFGGRSLAIGVAARFE